jgi:hypothetical protein
MKNQAVVLVKVSDEVKSILEEMSKSGSYKSLEHFLSCTLSTLAQPEDCSMTRIEAYQAQCIEYQTDIVALRYDLEVAEYERDQYKEELDHYRRD